MKKNLLSLIFISVMTAFSVVHAQNILTETEKEHAAYLLKTLSADEMNGRSTLTKDIDKAARFIDDEMKKIGLKPFQANSFEQKFHLHKIELKEASFIVNDERIPSEKIMIFGAQQSFSVNKDQIKQIEYVNKDDNFYTKFRELSKSTENTLVLVDPSAEKNFSRIKEMIGKTKLVEKVDTTQPKILFALTNAKLHSFEAKATYTDELFELKNLIGMLPGKSKKNEFVIFSAHYDHIGNIQGDPLDSIANGADDDASGVSAMLSLASYYKRKNINERTLLFCAFTGEEIGGYGSTYFSNSVNPDDMTAMINIEMIGKDSKFGPNSVYITGYDLSNLGELMNKNIEHTSFKFYPDPYPKQNLFYRSDNARLAAKGVPAHSFSTSQIDKDPYYHTVKDEFSTLDMKNIISSIEAIAIGATGLVKGTQTPGRIEKLND